MKLLVLVVVALLVIAWLSRGKAPAGAAGRSDNARAGARERGEAMLQCAHCHVHIPASEAVPGPAETVFCCEEHRRRGVARA